MYQEEAVQLATLLLSVVQAKQAALRQAQELFCQHPDHQVFAGLPGAGELLAPALLAKFGDDRKRFPRPASVQAVAGTCPVTDQSGKRKVIKFRHACDREFRAIVQQWARLSLGESTWGASVFQSSACTRSVEQPCFSLLGESLVSDSMEIVADAPNV